MSISDGALLHMTKQIQLLREERDQYKAERDALNLAAWKFTHTWINTEVDSCDEEYEGEMEKLNDLANAVMRLCKPPAPIDTAIKTV